MTLLFRDKLIAYLTLICGLAISAVAIYYSVLGLTSIFAAAVIPIIVMGITLEVSKLIATLWLKQNWRSAPSLIKFYLIVAIFILMCITSMGIFGFLSKSHNDQLLVNGNNIIQIAEIDRQINIEKRYIDDAAKVISQLDQAVQSLIDADRIRGPNGSIAVRKNQSAERDNLNFLISESTKKINALEIQKLPLLQQKLNMEAEVGPIKYISRFIYGSDLDKDTLEKAVTWMIIMLIVVFDPLAIVLLLASQHSFQSFKQNSSINEKINLNNEDKKIEPILENIVKIQNEEFDLTKHPYLFNVPKHRHPPGVDPVRPQVYKPDYTNNTEKLFVQNEEQKVSNLWSSTSTNIKKFDISEIDYLNISKEKLEEKINYFANLLRDKKIVATDIPTEILQEVKARV